MDSDTCIWGWQGPVFGGGRTLPKSSPTPNVDPQAQASPTTLVILTSGWFHETRCRRSSTSFQIGKPAYNIVPNEYQHLITVDQMRVPQEMEHDWKSNPTKFESGKGYGRDNYVE